MSAGRISHPIFARFFNRLSGVMEREAGAYRTEMLAGLSGTVVEVGAGNGMNFRHYPSEVKQVLALEPEPYLRAKAEQAAAEAPMPVTVRAATADTLPVSSGSCDAAVTSLVLCTSPDAAGALAELRRVLKPGGELRFFEHVQASKPGKARVQRAADRSGMWPLIGGGCHCSRDTLSTIEAAGFTITHQRNVDLGPGWALTNPHVLGMARVAR
jgi:ubiquinone/menaquinone biosynthesis C-methylase UbiE